MPSRSMYCQMSSSVQSEAGRPGSARPGPPAPGRAATVRAVAAWGPIGRRSHGTTAPVPWPAPCPRLAGPRRTRRRTRAVDGVEQCAACSRLREADRPRVRHPAPVDGVLHPGHDQLLPPRPPGRRGTRCTSGKLCPVSMCMHREGNLPGRKAFTARCRRTAESLPPLKRRTGRSDSAATSRIMKMVSDSRRARWSAGADPGPTRAVTDPPDGRSWRRRGRPIGCIGAARGPAS